MWAILCATLLLRSLSILSLCRLHALRKIVSIDAIIVTNVNMAELEIIDAEIVPQGAREQVLSTRRAQKDDVQDDLSASLSSLYPVYTREEREAALRLLAPSTHDVVLGAGWTNTEAYEDEIDASRRPSSSSTSSSASSPATPSSLLPLSQSALASHSNGIAELTDALLVRSCSQGWSLSFELTPHQPVPSALHPDEILVRNDAVGLNPVDWKSVSFNFGIPAFPWILGRDIAATIVQPPADNAEAWKVGDRVWTCADSREMRAGGYQRFSVHKKGTLAKIPTEMEDADAATLGTGLITAAVALFAFFKLPFAPLTEVQGLTQTLDKVSIADAKDDPSDWILIYGGGAVTGIYAAQLASISGLRVAAVASPSNFEYLTSIGVTACIDRHQGNEPILASISSLLAERGGQMRYAMDCVSSKTSDLCLNALHANPGGAAKELICLAGNPKADAGDVKVHKISFSTTFYHADGKFAREVLTYVTGLLEQKRLKPCRPEVLPDGLAGIRYVS
ncbi:protein TOXD [Pseudozyma hubeiensis SY62]|uniref:Protein TOXD n=1 Tax=Pseudozyma hubeiensis (strain SY62) TaxID=1305764 RepID=R9P875_PSEHS|nr:protein TOXD [Pseudozyma hubeiensis SY62]GAC97571.1 protein TOXD [Pseudozyma hubeiensis SY62]